MSLSERIKSARAAKGLSQAALGKAVGVSRVSVTQWESGETSPTHGKFPMIADALGVTVSDLLSEDAPLPPPLPPSNVRPAPQVSVPFPADLPRDLPVRGIAACSSGCGAFQFDADVVDWARRPPALNGIPEAYALYMSGDSMEPRLFHGRMVIVHPKRPVRPGDLCVIVMRDSPNDSEYAYCKALVRRHGGVVTVEQYNPPGRRDFPEDHIVAIHRVLEIDDLFGA